MLLCARRPSSSRRRRRGRGSAAAPGPLADYVAKEDKSYKWTKRREGELGTGRYAELTLTSQTWKNIVWKHQLFIYKPAKVTNEKQALLWIDGGKWNDDLEKPPTDGDPGTRARLLAAVGDQLQSPVALLLHVPQQPIFDGMVEDAIISHDVRAVLPDRRRRMAAACCRWSRAPCAAMDAVQEFTREEWKLDIESFTMTGASKRGWTTWLTVGDRPARDGASPRWSSTCSTWGRR